MEALLKFLQDDNEATNVGYGLLAAFALVYLGMAVSSFLPIDKEHHLLTKSAFQRNLLPQSLSKRHHCSRKSHCQHLQIDSAWPR